MVNINEAAEKLAYGLISLGEGFFYAQKHSKITIITSTSVLVFLVTSVKLASHQIFNRYTNWRDDDLRFVTEWSFSLLSATVLATSATVGLGLASSKTEAFLTALMGLSIILGGVLIVSGGKDIYDFILDLRRRNAPLAVAQPPQPVAVAVAAPVADE